jgi:hypothetical protein
MAAVKHLRVLIPIRPELAEAQFASLQIPVLLLIGENEILRSADAAVTEYF